MFNVAIGGLYVCNDVVVKYVLQFITYKRETGNCQLVPYVFFNNETKKAYYHAFFNKFNSE